MILFLISFIAGVLTVLAPCILPLLPVIVGGSLTGEGKDAQRKKVVTIVVALGVSVIAFTLLLKASTLFIEIPEYVWKWISGGIIIVLGLITVFPALWEGQWLARLSAKSNIMLGKGSQKKGFWGDVTIGAALGPVFSTCSPTYFVVLATVLPAQPLIGLLYLLTYTAGLCLALFFIAFVGQRIMAKLNIAANPKGWFKRSLGILFLLVGLAIITGYDKKLETSIINSNYFDVTKIEQRLLKFTEPSNDYDKSSKVGDAALQINSRTLSLAEKSEQLTLAKEISTPDGFINTGGEPITLEGLKGKVVLLEVWTYSCINCQRTIPYLNDWYDKYEDQGFEIVGLHTPEFAFEKKLSNVQDAVDKFSIRYPVVLDNDYSTWNDYGNKYWPRKYLIDIDGYIIYDHIGEGAYEETEMFIQKALMERNNRMGNGAIMPKVTTAPKNVVKVESGKVGSPEIYFGSRRNDKLANGQAETSGEQKLVIQDDIESNKLYLGGTWNITREYAENVGATSIKFKYDAKTVYFVAGSENGSEVEIYRDGVFVKRMTVQSEQVVEKSSDGLSLRL